MRSQISSEIVTQRSANEIANFQRSANEIANASEIVAQRLTNEIANFQWDCRSEIDQ